MNEFDKITYIQAVLAEDVYLDPETGKHRHRDETKQQIVIKFPDGSPNLELNSNRNDVVLTTL